MAVPVRTPIRFKGGLANLYGYVLNDPVNLLDSTGLEAGLCELAGNKACEQGRKRCNQAVMTFGGLTTDTYACGLLCDKCQEEAKDFCDDNLDADAPPEFEYKLPPKGSGSDI